MVENGERIRFMRAKADTHATPLLPFNGEWRHSSGFMGANHGRNDDIAESFQTLDANVNFAALQKIF